MWLSRWGHWFDCITEESIIYQQMLKKYKGINISKHQGSKMKQANSTTSVLLTCCRWIILCLCGEGPEHCRVFSNTPIFSSQDASITSSPPSPLPQQPQLLQLNMSPNAVKCPMGGGGQNCSQLRTMRWQ